MKRKSNFNGGYVGLLAMLLTIAIISFFALRMYERDGELRDDINTFKESTEAIRQAEEAREMLEGGHINIRPEIILPGDPVLIAIEASSSPVEVLWDEKDIPFFNYKNKPHALVAIDFNETRLKHKIQVRLKNGEELEKDVMITPREKIEKPLGIPEKLGGNTPEASKQLVNNLAKENAELNNVTTESTILWSEGFGDPLSYIYITDNYGYDRKTVGQTIVHKGTDFRAAEGTEVLAMNDGIVRIAKTYTVYGDTVVIDHGQGVQTLYMHLSKINVKNGDRVEKDEIIGLSGKTGYAAAAHLHISVKVNGVSIDPITFIDLFEK